MRPFIAFIACAILCFAQTTHAVAAEGEPATGFVIQARLPVQESLGAASGILPSFVLGYRANQRFTFGLGAGLSLLQIDVDGGGSASGYGFTLSPTVIADIWRSSDDKVRMNVLLQAGIGMAKLTIENLDIDFEGNEIVTESDVSALLIPVRAGLGGDYFMHPNFALGLEAGISMLFVQDTQADGQSLDLSVGTQALYGMLRASIVID